MLLLKTRVKLLQNMNKLNEVNHYGEEKMEKIDKKY
jgi:hypothetical protein